MENLEKDRPLHGELEGAAGEELVDHLGAARLVPEPVEDLRRTDAPRGARGELAPAGLGEHQHGLGEAGAGFEENLQAPFLAELVEPAQSGEHPLAAPALLPAVFDDLEVGVALDRLLSEEHGHLRLTSGG